MFKKILKYLWKILKNYYIVVTLLFVVWIAFIDDDNLINQYKQRKIYNELKKKKQYYVEEITRMKSLCEALTHDMDAMEKYGREKYLMKKPNEDIFLIVSTDTVQKK